ncbi:MAG: Serine/threonine-protein kinase PknH [Chlamydiae bacterium]|nr:Serine/threonine-protein kinase PknH [Chlamydiota bacterium]
MSHALSSAASYLTSFWKAEPSKAAHTFSTEYDPRQLATTQLATIALNQQISDLLPNCSLCTATLRETKQGELCFHSKSGETIIFSNENTMNQWLADKSLVDIWQFEDLREGRSGVFYKLQKAGKWGYDTFETRDKLFDQLREDYGVFWKLEDQGTNQISYIYYKPSIFGNRYVNINHENLIFVASSLKLKDSSLPASSSHASNRTSWGKGITACLLGGLLISAGRSWESNQNSVSDAIAMMPGTLGPAASKAAFVFQMSAIAAMSRQQGGALPGALLAGMMFLPESVQGQSLCPQLAGTYDTPDWAYDVALSGNYAYVADYASGLQIIDVSNVINPTLAGSYNTPSNAYGITVSGNYAYVADGTFGLQIIDVSNVANPTLAGSYNTPILTEGVAVSGNYAYVAGGTSGLQIIDVANVTNPTLAGSYDTSGYAIGLAVSGNYAYVADGTSGLQIIDVSNVANPTLAGSYTTLDISFDVVVSGNYAYVADGASGLQIIDVANVANPTLASSYDTPDYAYGVALSGNYAYVADRISGLQIIDVSNVANPTLAGFYDTTGAALDVTISGNYAYVADRISGLQIIKIPCPSPTSSSSTSSSTSSSSSSTTLSSSTTSTQISSSTTTSSSFSTSSSSTTGSISSSTSTNPASLATNNPTLFSTTNAPSSTSFVTEPSTIKFTTRYATRPTVSNGPSLLWLSLLGGGLCICLIGGTAFILRRRRKSSNNEASFIERGSEAHSSFELEPVVGRAHKVIGKQYYQLSTIWEEEAREIYRQTGHLVVIPEDRKKLKHVIGKGHFGAIKVAQRIEDGQYVVSKKVKGIKNIRFSEAEANLQREASGENILPIYNTIRLENTLYHFMPLAGLGDGSTIQEQLSTLKLPHLAIEILKFVTKNLLTGLNTLHRRGIYHLDIKPDNLVFTQDGTGYITDFGCARASSTPQIPSKAIGDTRYYSPERLQARREKTTFDGEKADIWAAGLTLLQIIKNWDPFQLFEMPSQLAVRIERCGPDFFQEKLKFIKELQYPEEGSIWWVIKGLLEPHPTTRFTALEALDAACFKGMNKTFQERMFEDLKREQISQTTQVKKEEMDLSNYGGIAQAAMMQKMREIYDSQQQQQYYFGEGYNGMPTTEVGLEHYQAPPENPAPSYL